MIDPSKPPIRITPHDELRLKIAQRLTLTMSTCLVLPIQHQGDMHDMVDIGVGIAEVLDKFEYESVELRQWVEKHGRSQRKAALRLADAVKSGDQARVQRIAEQLMYEHPLPTVVVDPDVERAA